MLKQRPKIRLVKRNNIWYKIMTDNMEVRKRGRPSQNLTEEEKYRRKLESNNRYYKKNREIVLGVEKARKKIEEEKKLAKDINNIY